MSKKNTLSYYQNLTPIQSFSQIFESRFFKPVPDDWYIILTDVVNSTGAIESGRYKEVNTAGGLPAMALANLFGDMNFPFFFGGDGMTCLLSGSRIEEVKDILINTGKLVNTLFGLELRLGVVPVRGLYEQGKTLNLARWEISPFYHQAILNGNALDEAERLVKTPGSSYLIPADRKPVVQADFTGYTCRWEDFRSGRDETIALLVKFRKPDSPELSRFFAEISQFLGEEKDFHPLQVKETHYSFRKERLDYEVKVLFGKTRGILPFLYRQLIRIQNGGVLMMEKLGIPLPFGHLKLNQMKLANILSSDFRKYDNSLKMVVAINTPQRIELTDYLETLRKSGLIYYGIHVSDSALLTCLLHTRSRREVHFVDANGGGYTLAAKMMKEQMKNSI